MLCPLFAISRVLRRNTECNCQAGNNDKRCRESNCRPSASGGRDIRAGLNEPAFLGCEVLRSADEPLARTRELIAPKQGTLPSPLGGLLVFGNVLLKLTFG